MSRRIRKKLTIVSFFLATLVLASTVVLVLDLPKPKQAAKAVDATMILFWDTVYGTIPTGWTCISDGAGEDFLNRYVRAASTYGSSEGGSTTHTHTVPASIVYPSSGQTLIDTRSSGNTAATVVDHNHGATASVAVVPANNLPLYRSLKVISYDSGIPSSIPQNAIAMFTSTGSLTAAWSAYSAIDGRLLRGEASTQNAGSNTHTHNVSSGAAAADTMPITLGTRTGSYAGDQHIHGAGAPVPTNEVSIIPPHAEIVFARATNDPTVIVDGMVAGFDDSGGATVPSPWDVISDGDESGYWQNKFLMGDSTTPGGADDGTTIHSHTSPVSVTTGAPNPAYSTADDAPAQTPVASGTHTHSVDIFLEENVNHLPAYWDLVLAQYSPAYTPDSQNWQWFDSEDVATPNTTVGGETTVGNAMATENSVPANVRIVYKLNAVKLRIVVGETGGAGGTDVKYKLQYDTTPLFAGATDVGAQGGTGALWRYYDGDNVADDDTVTEILSTSGSTSPGRHNEDSGTGIGEGSTFGPAASTTYEHEFTIQNYNATAGSAPYFFRLQYMENSRVGGSWTTVALNGSYSYPSISTAGAYDLELYQVAPTVFLGTYTLGSGDSLSYPFEAGEEIVFWDKTGLGSGYDVVVSSMSLVCAACGPDTIPGTDITWNADVITDLNGSFASDKTGMTAPGDGSTLDAGRTAYNSTSSVDPTIRTGGFFFLPTLDLGNLDSRVVGEYTGELVLTISA